MFELEIHLQSFREKKLERGFLIVKEPQLIGDLPPHMKTPELNAATKEALEEAFDLARPSRIDANLSRTTSSELQAVCLLLILKELQILVLEVKLR